MFSLAFKPYSSVISCLHLCILCFKVYRVIVTVYCQQLFSVFSSFLVLSARCALTQQYTSFGGNFTSVKVTQHKLLPVSLISIHISSIQLYYSSLTIDIRCHILLSFPYCCILCQFSVGSIHLLAYLSCLFHSLSGCAPLPGLASRHSSYHAPFLFPVHLCMCWSSLEGRSAPSLLAQLSPCQIPVHPSGSNSNDLVTYPSPNYIGFPVVCAYVYSCQMIFFLICLFYTEISEGRDHISLVQCFSPVSGTQQGFKQYLPSE